MRLLLRGASPATAVGVMAATTVTRFAPSPTGLLHLGHAHSALSRRRGAAGRRAASCCASRTSTPPAAARSSRDADLRGPRLAGARLGGPVRVQSEHMAEYRAALDALAARGCSIPASAPVRTSRARSPPRGQAPHGPDGPLYPGTCRRLRRPSAQRARPPASRTRCGWTWRRRWRRPRAPSDLRRSRRRPPGAATPAASATSCWRARTRPPATTCA